MLCAFINYVYSNFGDGWRMWGTEKADADMIPGGMICAGGHNSRVLSCTLQYGGMQLSHN